MKNNPLFWKPSLRSTIPFIFRFIFSIPILIILIISTTAYILIGSQSTKALVEQTHDRQLHLAVSGANTVSNFINLAGSSIVHTAKIIESSNENPQTYLTTFRQVWQNTPLVGISLLDKNGKIILLGNQITVPPETNDYNDRDYFIWATTAKQGEIFLGAPLKPRFGSKTNEFFVPIATPIFKNNTFDGVLVGSISVTELTNQYLVLLKFTDSTRIYLIDALGNMLYSPFPQIQGINYIEYLNNNPFPGSTMIATNLQSKAKSTSPGKLNTILPNAESKILTPFLIAHAPIFALNQHWTIAVATPTKDALAFVGPIYINQLGFLIVLFLVLLILIVRATKKRVYYEIAHEDKKK